MKRSGSSLIAYFILLFSHTILFSEESESNVLTNLSLEDLLNIEINVTSGKAKSTTLRESTGIVTLITREDIKNSGARDLYDLLRWVPGIQVNAEVQGALGYSMRGMWAVEGKLLFLVDSIPFNEDLYGNPIFGMQYFLNQIERIEIIRGPGSAIYGGFAELGVVNIITRSSTLDGAIAQVTVGKMGSDFGRKQVEFSYGKDYGSFKLAMSGGVGSSQTGDGIKTDYYGERYEMEDYGNNDSHFINIGLDFGNTSLRLHNDAIDMDSPDIGLPDGPLITYFDKTMIDLRHQWSINDTWTASPSINYSRDDSWVNKGQYAIDNEWYWYYATDRTTINLPFSAVLSDELDVVVGFEFNDYDGWVPSNSVGFTFGNGETQVGYRSSSLFAQGTYKHSFANFTAGARYDNHNVFGGVFVPRLAMTKTWDKWHSKVLFSKAYRAPTIDNLSLTPEIEPETTTVFELEFGYKLSSKSLLTANIFDITTKDVIVYFSDPEDPVNGFGFRNFPEVASQGLELDYQYRDDWGNIRLTYSYYKVASNTVPEYTAYNGDDVESDQFMGSAPNKITMNLNYHVSDKWDFNTNIYLLSSRYAPMWSDSDGDIAYGKFDSTFLLDINASYALSNKDTISFSIHDLFDEQMQFVAGYDHALPPTPGPSREIGLQYQHRW